MSSSNANHAMRQWMYARIDPNTNQVSNAFTEGLKYFMVVAKNHVLFTQKQKIFCPCIKCENRKFLDEQTVTGHLYNRGFMANYLVWVAHGEVYEVDNHSRHAQENTNTPTDVSMQAPNSYVEMISDAFNEHTSSHESIEEDPNEEAKRFFSLLNASQNPIYDGCREGHSQLSLAARCMTLKTDYNLSEKCMDYIAEMLKDYMPADNNATASYYDTKKLMRSLGLPYKKIDVCQNNCMIFWKTDADLESCKFCGAARFKSTKKPGRKQVPFRQMFYLPIADRLKRLYQSKKTASHMRWHKEHYSTQDSNVMSHPSDGEAWKHFNQVYPDFANESRNVYLGLCTDGFNPFGMSGQNYSLWPVILTPYNLPPDMCMKREFMFLTILIPGPNHPKRSLDVFLQPLIEELNGLWTDGVESYDVSLKQNFTLRAMLLWTISDFPAYAMLSGWTTHGRLACPYCMGDTEAFWLKHGRKTCWFDCHRRFLPKDHPLRRYKKNFKKNKVVDSDPPTIYSGEDLWSDHVMGLPKTVNCGGEGHPKISGYGEKHNWHKQSIFWELPYWKHLLLHHNLDVMHIEKNFFDNIINTLLNVQGKTKDNVKSRLDLADICNRKDLHMTSDGKAPVPLFRLSPQSKTCLFNWLKKEVKFSDGYSSNLSSSVDFKGGKLSGMKSHDCHVFMQRLLPIAFAELLPSNIHQALSGIYSMYI